MRHTIGYGTPERLSGATGSAAPYRGRVRSYDELVSEAVAADVDGWGFAFLTGRAGEERLPWRYSRLLAERLATVDSALDLDTGGGEVLDEAPTFPV